MDREIISQGSTGSYENKPLEPFYNFKETPEGTVLVGKPVGKFESKARPGSFFHVFEREDGTRFAAWDNTALSFRVQEVKEKEKELGLPDGTLYMETTFLGKPKGKKAYSFTKPTIFKVGQASAPASNQVVTNDEIPF